MHKIALVIHTESIWVYCSTFAVLIAHTEEKKALLGIVLRCSTVLDSKDLKMHKTYKGCAHIDNHSKSITIEKTSTTATREEEEENGLILVVII